MVIQPFLPPLLAVAALNGIFSPAVLPVLLLWPLWYPPFLPFSAGVAAFVTHLLVSTGTLMLAGIPAALYERLTARQESDRVSMWIWLAGVVLLSFPAILGALG